MDRWNSRSLFSDEPPEPAPAEGAPLAERMRPRSLTEFVGQTHLVGEGRILRRLLAGGGALPSLILWGAPGTGKTTLARLLADSSGQRFIALSAVFSGVKDLREAIQEAKTEKRYGKRTVLFIDEIHRFNKSQQDALLHAVENGTVTLIGATTENPSFEVNSALLSRAAVYVLQPLSEAELETLLQRALLQTAPPLQLNDAARELIVGFADGDARRLLNMVEQIQTAAGAAGVGVVDEAMVHNALTQSLKRFDKGGDQFYEQISALHKAVRGTAPDAALYWLCRMLDGGADPLYVGRRIVRMASEDIGLADPRALRIALDACETYERLGSPEGELALAEAALYLAVAPKSNAAYNAYNAARALIRDDKSRPVPEHLRNAPTRLMKELGYGRDYRYAHDEEDAYVAGENYFPDGLEQRRFYEPTERGLEAKIRARLAELNERDAAARGKK